jgi:hypothetical protein
MGKSSFATLAALAEGAPSRAAGDDAVVLVGEASDRVTSDVGDEVREHAAAATQAMPPTRMAIGLEEEGIGSRPSKERTYHCGARPRKPANSSAARGPSHQKYRATVPSTVLG